MNRRPTLRPSDALLRALAPLRQLHVAQLAGITVPQVSKLVNRKLRIPHNSRLSQKIERLAEFVGVEQVWR